jgi:hypothetical protein
VLGAYTCQCGIVILGGWTLPGERCRRHRYRITVTRSKQFFKVESLRATARGWDEVGRRECWIIQIEYLGRRDNVAIRINWKKVNLECGGKEITPTSESEGGDIYPKGFYFGWNYSEGYNLVPAMNFGKGIRGSHTRKSLQKCLMWGKRSKVRGKCPK